MDAKVSEVLEYAIERELEAAEFYQSLQSRVRSDSSKNMLKEFEKMEKIHAEKIRNFKAEDYEGFELPKIQDLKIADSMEAPEIHDNMTFQEILVTAMKREEKANRLYLILANATDDIAVRQLFLKLAAEESQHKLMLETLYDDEVLYEN